MAWASRTQAAKAEGLEEQRKALDAVSPDFKTLPANFSVSVIADHTAAARPDGKADDSLTRWKETLAHDPWIDESLSLLSDVIK